MPDALLIATGTFVIVLGLVLLAASAVLLKKVVAIHKIALEQKGTMAQVVTNATRQMEFRQQLQAELALPLPLPPTRGMAASPDFLHIIARHARAARPEVVVECSSGVSTVVLAQCMRLNGRGKVLSLEHHPRFAEIVREDLARYDLTDWAEVIDAPLTEVTVNGGTRQPWYDTSGLPDLTIDMLVIDGPPASTAHEARYPAGPLLFPRLAPGAHVFLDDTARSEDARTVTRLLREHPHLVAREEFAEKGCAHFVSPSPAAVERPRQARSAGASTQDMVHS